IEVNGLDTPIDRLATSGQARRYAEDFGVGLVLATNLWLFTAARLAPDGTIREHSSLRVQPADGLQDFLAGRLTDVDSSWRYLSYLLGAASLERGNLSIPRHVASLLAYHARKMRDDINAAGDPDEMFAPLRKALSDGLQIDLSGEHL